MTGRSPEVALRRAKALNLRRAGKSYPDIAAELGYSGAGSASKDVSRALDQVVQEAGKQLIQLERERLDGLLAILWPLAERGDVRAARECVRVMERRARLLGLDKARADVLADVRVQEGERGASLVGQIFTHMRTTCPDNPDAPGPDDN